MSDPHKVTVSGFKRIATIANTVVKSDENMVGDWMEAKHPRTGYFLQRHPDGYVSVHTSYGSWSSDSNTVSTLTAMWRGELGRTP